MLSVIVAPGDSERLPGLLAALTTAAVEGLVREVLIVVGGPPQMLDALCDATGAELAPSLPEAVTRARSDWLLVAPPDLRLKDGWIERLGGRLRDGPRPARLQGAGGGWLRRAPYGVLIRKTDAQASAKGGIQGLARKLGVRADRLG